MSQGSEKQGSNESVGGYLSEPDCVRCLRKKLKALGVVVFFKNDRGWHIGSFQSDKPQENAEIDFEVMLSSQVPELLAPFQAGLLLNNKADLEKILPSLLYLLEDCSVIAAPVLRAEQVYGGQVHGEQGGVRLAWRDATDPFTPEDLNTLQCFGQCPEDCV